MSYNALHYPENATPALLEKYRKLAAGGNDKEVGRAAIAEDLDRGVGELLAKLDAMGLSKNTIVIYMLRQRRPRIAARCMAARAMCGRAVFACR